MLRPARLMLAVALVASALAAQAEGVRVLAPADGATLRGGSFAELNWSAAQLPAGAEEWEAFLSIDGGKYYGFRITPHLDVALRRFTFNVPNVDSRDARILIRAGNERQETEFVIPGSFAIARDAHAEESAPRLLAFGRGEAARPGDPEVLAWAEGSRNGSAITAHAAPPERSSAFVSVALIGDEATSWLAPPALRVVAPTVTHTQLAPRVTHAREAVRLLPRTADLLLVCRRRNI
jgi:hypothetical protein